MKKTILPALLSLALVLVLAASIALFLPALSKGGGENEPTTDEESADSNIQTKLFYEIWVNGALLGETDNLSDFFLASDTAERVMAGKLGATYSLSDDLDIKIVSIRKNSKSTSVEDIYDSLMSKVSRLYSDCYAFYVGSEVVGYCPLSEKDALKDLTVEIIKYVSDHNTQSISSSTVYAALGYARKDAIINDVSTISDALVSADIGGTHLESNFDDAVIDVIESIDNAIVYGNTSAVTDKVTPTITVTSVRRVETEVIKYSKLRRPDTYYGLKYGDDDEFVHVKGKNGECTVQYEDVYIEGKLSRSIRLDDTQVVTAEAIDEVTVYGTASTHASSFDSKGDFVWPTVGWITSEYGPRKAEFNGMSTYHQGIDISTLKKTNIVAAAPGKVIYAGWGSGAYSGFGYCVVIDHENGYKTLYAHMYKKPFVSVGERVYQGEVIGGQGMTGSANGIHLHFELRKASATGDQRINPRTFLPKGDPPTKW